MTFQSRVQKWMVACFGEEVSADRLERCDRLLEEVFELLQAVDYPRERIRALEAYVNDRTKGEPAQEVGGVMLTLAAFCEPHGLDMHQAGETELVGVWGKIDKIRAKQAAKPHGSALPVAVHEDPVEQACSAYWGEHWHKGFTDKTREDIRIAMGRAIVACGASDPTDHSERSLQREGMARYRNPDIAGDL